MRKAGLPYASALAITIAGSTMIRTVPTGTVLSQLELNP